MATRVSRPSFIFLFICLVLIHKSERGNLRNACTYFWSICSLTDDSRWQIKFACGLHLSCFANIDACLFSNWHLILKWSSSVTFIQYFMFMHVECFILLNANPLLHLYGWPFETFWEASSFVLRASQCSWIFHFLMRLLPVITLLLGSSRTYHYRSYSLCFGHTHLYTLFFLKMPPAFLAYIPHVKHTHTYPGRLCLSWHMNVHF